MTLKQCYGFRVIKNCLSSIQNNMTLKLKRGQFDADSGLSSIQNNMTLKLAT